MSGFANLVEEFVLNPTAEEINEAMPAALLKLQNIIKNDGDANGARMLLGYFAQLIAEQIQAGRAEKFTFADYGQKKRRVAKANAPTSHNHFSGCSEKSQGVNITIFITEVKS